MAISVCIPTFEQYGFGSGHLHALLKSLQDQKGKFEVIVSDNSQNADIEYLCSLFVDKLDLKYFHNPIIGISANTNNAIEKANYDKIKIMYMDDLCTSAYTLAHFSESLNRKAWAVSDSHKMRGDGSFKSTKHPHWSVDIIRGFNTIGMPSVIAFRKNEFRFDIQLKTLLDCEYYWLLHRAFGEPEWIRKPIIAQRYHENSTSTKQGNMRETEWEYLKTKHPELALMKF